MFPVRLEKIGATTTNPFFGAGREKLASPPPPHVPRRRSLSGSRARSPTPVSDARRSLPHFPLKHEFKCPRVVKASHAVKSLPVIPPRSSPPKPEIHKLIINNREIAENLLLDAFPGSQVSILRV